MQALPFFIHKLLFSNRALLGMSVLLELIAFPVWGKTNKQVYSFRGFGNCRSPVTFLEQVFNKGCQPINSVNIWDLQINPIRPLC